MTPSTPEPPLVLVVDDYQDAREMYAEYLAFSGFRVAEAQDGAEALERAFALKPDVILMDLSLPVMDGWEASRRLRDDPRTRDIPVVALTGHTVASGGLRSAEGRLAAVITKPCLPEEIVREVRKQLEARSATAPRTPFPPP